MTKATSSPTSAGRARRDHQPVAAPVSVPQGPDQHRDHQRQRERGDGQAQGRPQRPQHRIGIGEAGRQPPRRQADRPRQQLRSVAPACRRLASQPVGPPQRREVARPAGQLLVEGEGPAHQSDGRGRATGGADLPPRLPGRHEPDHRHRHQGRHEQGGRQVGLEHHAPRPDRDRQRDPVAGRRQRDRHQEQGERQHEHEPRPRIVEDRRAHRQRQTRQSGHERERHARTRPAPEQPGAPEDCEGVEGRYADRRPGPDAEHRDRQGQQILLQRAGVADRHLVALADGDTAEQRRMAAQDVVGPQPVVAPIVADQAPAVGDVPHRTAHDRQRQRRRRHDEQPRSITPPSTPRDRVPHLAPSPARRTLASPHPQRTAGPRHPPRRQRRTPHGARRPPRPSRCPLHRLAAPAGSAPHDAIALAARGSASRAVRLTRCPAPAPGATWTPSRWRRGEAPSRAARLAMPLHRLAAPAALRLDAIALSARERHPRRPCVSRCPYTGPRRPLVPAPHNAVALAARGSALASCTSRGALAPARGAPGDPAPHNALALAARGSALADCASRGALAPGPRRPWGFQAPRWGGGSFQDWICGPLRPVASRGRPIRPSASRSAAGPAP